MKDRLIMAGSYLLAGLVACTALAAVATAVASGPQLPVTVASQEAESIHIATGGGAFVPQARGRRVP